MTANSVEVNQEMVERLYERTLNSAVAWELNADRNPFTNLAGYRVVLSRTWRGNGAMEDVSVISNFDELIDSFTDEDLDNDFNSPKSFDSYFKLMEALREKAFRQAVGADKAIASIMDVLRR